MNNARRVILISALAILALFIVPASLTVAGQSRRVKPATVPSKTSMPEANAVAAIDYNRVFLPEEVTQKARITRKFQPRYTKEARQNGVEGTVALQVVLASTGQVIITQTLNELPFGLTEKAIEAAHLTEFTPAMKDGRTVSQATRLEYNFSLDKYYDEDDLTLKSKAVILEQPAPDYTEEARKNNVQGEVELLVGLSPRGKANFFGIIKALPDGLTEQAIKVVRQIKFIPATGEKGKPVPVLTRVIYEFKLK